MSITANNVFSGPSSGSPGYASWRALVAADIPSLPYIPLATATAGNLLIGSGTAWVTNAMSGDATIDSAGVAVSSAIDLTQAQTLQVTCTFSANQVSANTCTQRMLTVKAMN